MSFSPLHVGIDFNVSHMAAVCGEIHNGKIYIVKEYIDYLDTPDIVEAIQNDFPDKKVIAYPDATGSNRKSTNAQTSDIAILRAAGFTIRAKTINPSVKDRIASVNRAFERQILFINTTQCPELTESLEQQVYKDNGQPDKTSNIDHALDALGYLVHYIAPVRKNAALITGVSH